MFPAEVMRVPREAVARKYDLRQWTDMPVGGHFAAMEQPDALVEDVRSFFRPLRAGVELQLALRNVLWSVCANGSSNSFILSIVVSSYDQLPSSLMLMVTA